MRGAGLATDFCVAFSALDARADGFETFVIEARAGRSTPTIRSTGLGRA